MWFSTGWATKEAENVFVAHCWESGCSCVAGFWSCGLYKVSVFVLASPIAWHSPLTHPQVLVECVKLRWNYSLATFLCHIVCQLCSFVNKGQTVWFGLALLPAVCEKEGSFNEYYTECNDNTNNNDNNYHIIIMMMMMMMMIWWTNNVNGN